MKLDELDFVFSISKTICNGFFIVGSVRHIPKDSDPYDPAPYLVCKEIEYSEANKKEVEELAIKFNIKIRE